MTAARAPKAFVVFVGFLWPDDVLDDLLAAAPSTFSCAWSSAFDALPGDRVFLCLVRPGGQGAGVFASGLAVGDSRAQARFAALVDVAWRVFLDPRVAANLLDVERLLEDGPELRTRPGSEIEISSTTLGLLEETWERHVAGLGASRTSERSGDVAGARPAMVRSPLGLPYEPAAPSPVAGLREPFEVDPDVVDRGTQAHASTQNALAEFLRQHGVEPRGPAADEPMYDLAWAAGERTFVAEVKSTTDVNEEAQLRLGLGQVLRYRHALSQQGYDVVAVLVAERRPDDPSWGAVCASVNVHLTWPDAFDAPQLVHAPRPARRC